MKRIIFKYIAVASVMLGMLSCEKELEITQNGSVSLEEYYGSDESAEGAVTAIYSELRDMQYDYKFLKNICSDDVWAGGANRGDNSDLERMNEFTFTAEHAFLSGCFESYYSIIYDANIVLTYIEADSDIKKQMIAEAKVFRAFAYIDLISMWGTPPLVDHPLEPSEYSMENGDVDELWAFVEQDLTDAIESGYLVEKSGVDDNSVYRVTKQFAQALLGKAHLYQEDYSAAASVFEEVISSGLYDLYDGDYDDITAFSNKNNCESLFESNRVVDENNVWNNFNMYQLMIHWRSDRFDEDLSEIGLASLGWGFCAPQEGLYDAFVEEEGEDGYRLNLTMKTYEQVQEMGVGLKSGLTIIGEGYFWWKSKITSDEVPAAGYGFAWDANSQIMRYADVLLMAAEANLQAGSQDKADTYLNLVRSRAQLSSKTATMDAIKLERRLELCFEDVRYQDLIRWGDAATILADQGESYPVMAANGTITYKSVNSSGKYGFQEKNALFPFPAQETELNTNIEQNTGW
ncbi:RagB/SusD family nutrient uptake outer membrane protein [Carboxylicivirga caseinilyticus]|uniref:RagB/SusD family nutrient uptake outer membrane protein n=1 Tax=Carboxylicivirga caseinilyticus TaxID=3417572 RepID=UPI003D32F9D4|nr:RagB/SusD family nutrient uptake outer membrane protein [Marinilabiliaceae bacterium A049]